MIFYVHYDPSSKKIINFRNYFDKDDLLPFIELKSEDIDVPMQEFSITDYRLIDKDNKLLLKKIKIDEVYTITKIDSVVYQVPKIVSAERITQKDHSFDLLIEQNNFEREFRIKLSRGLREKYKTLNVKSQTMEVYVTAINDPNLLHKTLRFTINDILNNQYYTIPFNDFDGSNVNIYLIRFFQEYLHADIR